MLTLRNTDVKTGTITNSKVSVYDETLLRRYMLSFLNNISPRLKVDLLHVNQLSSVVTERCDGRDTNQEVADIARYKHPHDILWFSEALLEHHSLSDECKRLLLVPISTSVQVGTDNEEVTDTKHTAKDTHLEWCGEILSHIERVLIRVNRMRTSSKNDSSAVSVTMNNDNDSSNGRSGGLKRINNTAASQQSITTDTTKPKEDQASEEE